MLAGLLGGRGLPGRALWARGRECRQSEPAQGPCGPWFHGGPLPGWRGERGVQQPGSQAALGQHGVCGLLRPHQMAPGGQLGAGGHWVGAGEPRLVVGISGRLAGKGRGWMPAWAGDWPRQLEQGGGRLLGPRVRQGPAGLRPPPATPCCLIRPPASQAPAGPLRGSRPHPCPTLSCRASLGPRPAGGRAWPSWGSGSLVSVL